MQRSRTPLPVADGCRLVLAEEYLGDLDLALAFLGLERSDLPVPEGEEEEDHAESPLQELDPEIADADDFDELGELDEIDDLEPDDAGWYEEFEESDPIADKEEDDRAETLLDLDWFPFDGEGTGGKGDGTSDFFRRHSRSMIAHLLAPDVESPDEEAEQTVTDYNRITNRVQRVKRRGGAPDAESWRVATRLSDTGPRLTALGKLDIRECVNRIARAEVISSFPRKKTRKQMRSIEVLIDADLTKVVFSFDVDQLQRALQSMGSSSMKVRSVLGRDEIWFAGAGPIWTFAPLTHADRPTWHMLIAGGQAGTKENIERWDMLVSFLERKNPVSMVWLGDAEGVRASAHAKRWITFRS